MSLLTACRAGGLSADCAGLSAAPLYPGRFRVSKSRWLSCFGASGGELPGGTLGSFLRLLAALLGLH